MRVTYPRAPHMVTLTIKGKQVERPIIGYAQFVALATLMDFGPQEPPPGVITATGENRKHLYNDMLPYGWVNIKKPGGKQNGGVDYFITKNGRAVLEEADIAGGAKNAKKANRLLERQRALARQAGMKLYTGHRKTA